MSGPALTTAEVRGVVAILPTPSNPDAGHWDAVDTVNIDETVRMTEAIVSSGVDIILTNGTFGEAATLTLPELLTFNDAVIRTVAGRVPVVAGATTLNTRDTIDRSRRLRDLGADGLFVGRPMWLPLDDAQIVDFYRSIGEALPDMPIVAYDNPSAFKGKISPAAYAGLATIPQVIAAKQTGGPQFADDLAAVGGSIRLLPPADHWYGLARSHPDEVVACWSGDVASGPAPLVALRDAVLARDWDRAEAVDTDLRWACETLFPNGDFAEFMRYSIQIDRAEFAAAGYIDPGPTRPPYHDVPDAQRECGAEVGRRWSQLHVKYAADVVV